MTPTPMCPHCGQTQLEYEDTIDQFTDCDCEGGTLIEFTVAHCPRCRHDFSYNAVFQMTFAGFEDIRDDTEDEKEEERGDCDSDLEEEEPGPLRCCNCGWNWREGDEEYPRCHYPDDGTPAPCEYDD